jgi:hypothetical protein
MAARTGGVASIALLRLVSSATPILLALTAQAQTASVSPAATPPSAVAREWSGESGSSGCFHSRNISASFGRSFGPMSGRAKA